jgi:DNA polymerase-3 subunit beta
LRHAKAKAALLSIETPAGIFVSRLVDGVYPDYARIIPKPSGNTATLKRDVLAMALTRLAATGSTSVQLVWAEAALQLTDRDTEDLLDAEISGIGTVRLTIAKLAALLGEFRGKTVTIEIADPATPIRILDRDDAGYLAILAPSSGAPA